VTLGREIQTELKIQIQKNWFFFYSKSCVFHWISWESFCSFEQLVYDLIGFLSLKRKKLFNHNELFHSR
jgi:hypothetical protein